MSEALFAEAPDTNRLPPRRAQAMIEERLAHLRSPSQFLSDTLLRLGYLTPEKLAEIQRKRAGAPLGRYCVKTGVLSDRELEYVLGVHLGFLHERPDAPFIPDPVIVARNPFSPQAEAFRTLRTRLTAGEHANAHRCLAITGANTRTDTSYAAINLAVCMAQLGRRTLLIDADLRAPTLGRAFGDEASRGLVEAVRGGAAFEGASRPTIFRSLDLMPAGAVCADPQSLFGLHALGALCQRLHDAYEEVIIKTAPFGGTLDSELVWSATRSALIVIERNKTRARQLESICKSARRVDASIAGAVLLD